MSSKTSAYLQLIRPVNVVITAISIAAAVLLAGGMSVTISTILLASLTGALVAGGANAINDFFDIEIDRVNRPDRPLPNGKLERADARRTWLVLSGTAIVLNCFVNAAALGIVVIAVAILHVYSAKLKRTVLAGNVAVAAMTGTAFLYGGAVSGNINRTFIPALFAFLINLGRELVKDAEDVEGDSRDHAITLPVKYGVPATLYGASAVLLILVAATIVVSLLSMYGRAFIYVVSAVDLMVCYVAIKLLWKPGREQLHQFSLLLKVAMVGGLVSILAGS